MTNNNLLPPDMTKSSSHNRYLVFPSFNLYFSLSDYKGFKTVILRVWRMVFHEYLKYLTVKDKTGGNIGLKEKHTEEDKPEWKHVWISSGRSKSVNTDRWSRLKGKTCVSLCFGRQSKTMAMDVHVRDFIIMCLQAWRTADVCRVIPRMLFNVTVADLHDGSLLVSHLTNIINLEPATYEKTV